MKPRNTIATTRTPDGGEMTLVEHDDDFSIKINGYELMNSRQHESELELARLGCAHITESKAPAVLIGGLGMGYTLRQVLDMLGPNASVVVCELLDAVVDWNREFLGNLTDHPLKDSRVTIVNGDIIKFIEKSRNKFNTILLDIDNGPNAMTDSGNRSLYGRDGIKACRRALRSQGTLAVWSAEPSKSYEQLLVRCNFHVRRYRSAAYPNNKALSRYIWLASENKATLPPGGGEPRMPPSGKRTYRPGRR